MFEKLLPVLERLTFRRVLLWALAAFSAILLHWVWEQRESVFITLTGSPFSLLTIGAIVIVVAMAWVAAMFVSMSEQRTAVTMQQMAARITASETHSGRQDNEITRLHGVIDYAVREERRECEARISQLIEVMGNHGIRDRRLNSKLGELR